MSARRRRFGLVRKLPSGRYQARYPGPDGIVRPADDTFGTKTEAENWLTLKEAEILEGEDQLTTVLPCMTDLGAG